MPKFRQGDIVSVKCEVQSDYEYSGSVRVKIVGEYCDIHAPVSKLEMVAPKLSPGELVLYSGRQAEVVAQSGEEVWISYQIGMGEIVNATAVTRLVVAEPEPEIEAEAPPLTPVVEPIAGSKAA